MKGEARLEGYNLRVEQVELTETRKRHARHHAAARMIEVESRAVAARVQQLVRTRT